MRCLIGFMVMSMALADSVAEAGIGKEIVKGVGGVVMREAVENSAEVGAKAMLKRAARETVEFAGDASLKRSIAQVDDVARMMADCGVDVCKGVARLKPASVQRLKELAPELRASGHGAEVLTLIAEHGEGDQILDFLYRNKGTLVGSAVVATLLANPESALAAGSGVVQTAIRESAEHIGQPMVENLGPGGVFGAFVVTVVLGLTTLSTVIGLCLWKGRRGNGAQLIASIVAMLLKRRGSSNR